MARRRPVATVNRPGVPVAISQRPQTNRPNLPNGVAFDLTNYYNQHTSGQKFKLPRKTPFGGFTPYKPPPIPSGSYDPALDAARGAATRGLGDLQQDANRDTLRDTTDYGIGTSAIDRAQGRGVADINTQVGRTTADLDTRLGRGTAALDQQLGRGNEDLNRQVSMLQRGYQRLGSRQGEQINAAGVSGGAALQAAAKRAENQAFDMQPIDTARSRLTEDVGTARQQLTADDAQARGRLGEDSGLQLGRLGEDSDLQRASLALDLAPADPTTGFLGGRRAQDRATGIARAGREDVQFGIDTEAQKAFQAAGVGYVAPGRGAPGGIPKGEHVGARGNPYRVVRRGGVDYYVRPDGSVAKKKRVR